MKEVTSSEFKNLIKDKTVLADFSAVWCGPCKMITPLIEKAQANIEDVEFIKIDVDKEHDLAKEYNITTVPTLIMFKGAQEKERFSGFMPQNKIEEFVNRNK